MISIFETRCTPEELEIASRVLAGGKLVMGEHVEALEAELSQYTGAHAVTCGSGTDALAIAIEQMVPRGKQVIVPAMSFSATLEAVLIAGCKPIVVDVNPSTLTPDLVSIKAAITQDTAAVIVVHLYGWSAPAINAIAECCAALDLVLIEDTAQAFGALVGPDMAGTIGDAGAFSFYPTKPLGGIGDGGAVIFRDKKLAQRAKERRNHGRDSQRRQKQPGFNSRIDEINAAVLRHRLKIFDTTAAHLRRLVDTYDGMIGDIAFMHDYSAIPSPYVYPVLVKHRDDLQRKLKSAGIETLVHYDPPISALPYVKANCPSALTASQMQLSLPCHRGMTIADVEMIAEQVFETV